MGQAENIFVFVVCGAREHIDTLHFSLRALKKFSKNKIIVVTDSRRNAIPVAHSDIVDIPAPREFDHHQASIYLKTGLYKYLPKGNTYCYLDTDVVALDGQVNNIFTEYAAPITFCTDHCVLEEFSPSAIYCGCYEAFRRDSVKPYEEYHYFQKNILPRLLYMDKCIVEIETLVAQSKSSAWLYRWHRFKFALPGQYYHLNGQYKMDKKTGVWYDQNNTPLKYEDGAKDDILYVSNKTGFMYSSETKEWSRPDGSSLTRLSCTHLIDKLSEKFDVHVKPSYWQHWNGGVFLFNDESHSFLEYWHNATMEIFKDKNWKTRDQGTLAATVWQFCLKDHPTLPIAYNLIADHNNETIEYAGGLAFKIGRSKKNIKPHFVHIYHHWGDTAWAAWRDVAKHIAG
jgi:hypothetical protein